MHVEISPIVSNRVDRWRAIDRIPSITLVLNMMFIDTFKISNLILYIDKYGERG